MTFLKNEPTRIPPEACPGCPTGSRVRVGARGNLEAPIAAIGEAPGGRELHIGIPFVGPSGEVLEKCLPLNFDIDSQMLVLNAMQCCPPKNKNQARDKQLKIQCVNACRQGVQDILWSHPRKVLLVMGNYAAAHLLGDPDFKITTHRGDVDCVLDPIRGTEVQVVYAMHPASLLHGRGSLAAFKDDVHKAIELAYGSELLYGKGLKTVRETYLEPTYVVLETTEQVRALIARIRAQNRDVEVASDLETHTFNPWTGRILCEGLYFDWDDNVAYIIPWRNLGDPLYVYAVDYLHTLSCIKWIWQNGKYDRRFLTLDPKVRVVPRLDDDTLLLSYALDEASKAHSLEEQAKNLLGAPNYKDVLKQWAPKKSDSYENVPEPALFDYLAKDVKNTFCVKQITREQVRDDPHLEKLYTRTLLPASILLTEIELYGIQIDPYFVRINRDGTTEEDIRNGRQPEKGLLQEAEELKQQLAQMAGREINPNSPQEVSAFLYDELGLKIKGKRPTDTRKETLDKLPPHPAAKAIRLYRRLIKMVSTYVTAIEKRQINNRIHTSYKLHASTTGRPSSTEPNILNIPREARYRRMYCAKEGYILIEGDYNTAELRGLAAISGDKFLTGVFLDDSRNLHDEVAIEMYGPNFNGDQRIRAKAINFGIPYGREAFSIAEEFNITVHEAQRLIDTWFARAPEAYRFLMKCRAAPLKGQTLITAFGRKRRPGLVSRERIHNLQNEFANFFMQSMFSADLAMHSSLRMHEDLKKEGAHLVNIPYDSTVIECPEEPKTVARVAEIQQYYMEHTPTLWIKTPIRFKVDTKAGTHWGLLSKEHPGLKLLEAQRQYLQLS